MNILVTQVAYFSSVCIIKLLKRIQKFDINIIGCSKWEKGFANGSLLVDKYYVSPDMSDPQKYMDFLSDLYIKESIDFVISADEEELIFLKKSQWDINHRIVIPDLKVLELFRDKEKATLELNKKGILCPTIYENLCKINKEVNPIVVFRKKNSYASKGIWITDLREKYIENHFSNENFVQEYIKGTEYTVDVFCDRNGKLIVSIPRVRLDIRNGISYKSQIVENKEIIEICRKIYDSYLIPGFSNIQFIERNSEIYFIELNTRYAGTGIASSLASFNIMNLFIEHFVLQKSLKPYEYYEKYVCWNSIITRYYEENIYNQ